MRGRLATLAACLLAAAIATACSNPLGPQYEYEEQLYLSVDGSAEVVVDSSLAALVALRAAPIAASAFEAVDRDEIRRAYEAAKCPVDTVGRLWRRSGRRFVQIRISTDNVRTLSACGLLSWSTYALTTTDAGLRYQQSVGAATAGDPGPVNWDGGELVAFKLHLPSRIRSHSVKLLDGTNGTVERGNILTWEQTLSDRRAGKPIEMSVDMDATSILNTTLWLFGGAFAAAVLVLVMAIWLTIRKGRKGIRPTQP